MKREHRRWHRRIWWLLMPVMALSLALLSFAPELPPDNTTLPPALAGTSAALGSR